MALPEKSDIFLALAVSDPDLAILVLLSTLLYRRAVRSLLLRRRCELVLQQVLLDNHRVDRLASLALFPLNPTGLC
jgi:hypothetical protein